MARLTVPVLGQEVKKTAPFELFQPLPILRKFASLGENLSYVDGGMHGSNDWFKHMRTFP